MPIQTAQYLLQANWQAPAAFNLSTVESSWLLETDSLTARLKNKSTHFNLQLMSEQVLELPMPVQLKLQHDSHVQCIPVNRGRAILREVMLHCDQLAMVYAQSWLPHCTLQAIAPLAELGEQPLGEFIFRHPALQRGPIELARLNSKQLRLGASCPQASMWARRSVFILDHHPLLVVEAFLPPVFQL